MAFVIYKVSKYNTLNELIRTMEWIYFLLEKPYQGAFLPPSYVDSKSAH
jgi:hypothetical protein